MRAGTLAIGIGASVAPRRRGDTGGAGSAGVVGGATRFTAAGDNAGRGGDFGTSSTPASGGAVTAGVGSGSFLGGMRGDSGVAASGSACLLGGMRGDSGVGVAAGGAAAGIARGVTPLGIGIGRPGDSVRCRSAAPGVAGSLAPGRDARTVAAAGESARRSASSLLGPGRAPRADCDANKAGPDSAGGDVAGSGASGGGMARLGTAADRAGVTVAPRARVNGEGRASGAIGGGGARMSPAAADVKTAAAAAGGEPAEAEASGTVTAQRPARARQAVTI
jgi:hypothetical protein